MRILLCMFFSITLAALHAQYVMPLRPATKTLKKSNIPDPIDSASIRKLNADNMIGKLRQDNMPCIIPLQQNQKMPNVYNQKNYPNPIPNFWDKQKDSVNKKAR